MKQGSTEGGALQVELAEQRSSDPSSPRSPFTLDPAELARRFETSAPVFWTVAAAVLGDREGAEDVLQEACRIALEKRELFRESSNFEAWMVQIVRYVALNQRRARRGSLTADPLALDEEWCREERLEALALGSRGELEPGQEHFDDELVAALGVLSPLARACLLLRTVRQLEYREIAQLLGLPEGTAMSHVHRSRATMRALLSARSGAQRRGGSR